MENIVMTTIKHLQINQIFALNDPKEVDMPLNEPNQTKPNQICVLTMRSLVYNNKTLFSKLIVMRIKIICIHRCLNIHGTHVTANHIYQPLRSGRMWHGVNF